MKEGIIAEALAGEQQKYGNITSLDEKSLEYIALIMGDKVANMATMGLGASNPEAIVGAIIDRANELANAGYNSIGQYVGEQQARRELYSYLMKYSPQIADIFATMQEEQHNINSIFRNQVDTFEKFKNSMGMPRGVTQAGEGVLVTLGQEWNVFKQTLDDIKYALAVSIGMISGISFTLQAFENVTNLNVFTIGLTVSIIGFVIFNLFKSLTKLNFKRLQTHSTYYQCCPRRSMRHRSTLTIQRRHCTGLLGGRAQYILTFTQ